MIDIYKETLKTEYFIPCSNGGTQCNENNDKENTMKRSEKASQEKAAFDLVLTWLRQCFAIGEKEKHTN